MNMKVARNLINNELTALLSGCANLIQFILVGCKTLSITMFIDSSTRLLNVEILEFYNCSLEDSTLEQISVNSNVFKDMFIRNWQNHKIGNRIAAEWLLKFIRDRNQR